MLLIRAYKCAVQRSISHPQAALQREGRVLGYLSSPRLVARRSFHFGLTAAFRDTQRHSGSSSFKKQSSASRASNKETLSPRERHESLDRRSSARRSSEIDSEAPRRPHKEESSRNSDSPLSWKTSVPSRRDDRPSQRLATNEGASQRSRRDATEERGQRRRTPERTASYTRGEGRPRRGGSDRRDAAPRHRTRLDEYTNRDDDTRTSGQKSDRRRSHDRFQSRERTTDDRSTSDRPGRKFVRSRNDDEASVDRARFNSDRHRESDEAEGQTREVASERTDERRPRDRPPRGRRGMSSRGGRGPLRYNKDAPIRSSRRMEDPQSRRDYKIRSPKDASLVAQDDGPAERPVVSTIEATATRDSIFGNKSWEAIGLSAELQTAVKALGFHKPTLIQQLAIPTLSSSLKDVMFADQTGTGKTLAYLLPIFQALRDDERKNGLVTQPNRPRALVILPSKELAEQVTRVAKKLGHEARLRVLGLIGGRRFKPENDSLETKPVDIIVTTPGRLFNHRERERVFISKLRHIVIDESDSMMAKDFKEELMKLFIPVKRRQEEKKDACQVVFVSATLSQSLMDDIHEFFPECQKIVTPSLHKVIGTVTQEFVSVAANKHAVLVDLLKSHDPKDKVIVFCNTIDSCRSTDYFLQEKGFDPACYHGEVPPLERRQNYQSFLDGDKPILVCTDVGSRGIDTTDVDHVILFDFPLNVIDYIHRVGRTARTAKPGRVTSLIRKKDRYLADAIQAAVREGRTLEGVTSKPPSDDACDD